MITLGNCELINEASYHMQGNWNMTKVQKCKVDTCHKRVLSFWQLDIYVYKLVRIMGLGLVGGGGWERSEKKLPVSLYFCDMNLAVIAKTLWKKRERKNEGVWQKHACSNRKDFSDT